MKRSYLRRSQKPLKRSYLKRKPIGLGGSKLPRRGSKLRIKGISDASQDKREIQALLRQLVILRDGGCWMRHYSEAGSCGGRRNDGTIIYQAEHLHTRANSASYADSRLVVCICVHHHIHWKPQHSARYNELARDFIGEKRSKLWAAVQADRSPHKIDWKIAIIGLNQELKALSAIE